ncbi:class I SAM-dependent methyltransferase [Labrys neptuniae]|uniref:class I SAM-dependent methyltransferase n=1 Tax=Labrys neptuniae TaxID=376174 RepID=UPI00288E131A|nr:class I SAM-dependent methyltransferase [Labrys neptuniae]MDT3378102.1 class I SAM-dependent methyltransferase [Labrys neptuniae]
MTSDAHPANFAEAQARTRASYDEIPYVSHAFPQTHPARLAATARLFGLEMPPLGKMRVLEIGCASGGNLIPLAAAYPEGRFLGLDLSGIQIADGRKRIEAIGLTNIELRQQDITFFDNPGHRFDFILCHGVYSWVPEPVRHAILDICSKYLEFQGIAYVSFNVLPGWRPKQILRDALMAHVGKASNQRERISKAREFMGFLAEHAPPGPYGAAVKEGVAQLQKVSDDYLAHEFLELENAPCSFHDFMYAAGRHQLAYLGESDVHMMVPENFGGEAAKALRMLGGNTLLETENYIDVLTGRTFRQTLLIPPARAAATKRNIDAERIEDLHLIADIAQVPSSEPDMPYCFENRIGRQIRTRVEVVRKAYQLIAARRPATSNYRQLVADIEATDQKKLTPQEKSEIRGALLQGVLSGLTIASTEAVAVGAAEVDRPRATMLARRDAASGRTRTVNRRHENFDLGVVAQHVVPVMDGSLTRRQLLDHLKAKAAEDTLHFQRNGQRVRDEADIAACAQEHLTAMLDTAWNNALIEP